MFENFSDQQYYARFNKGLIENCQRDINKLCQSEIIDQDSDDKDSDEDDGDNDDKDTNKNDDPNT
ncbi:unnamed protein product, partial [Rotaria magnacalcarata]